MANELTTPAMLRRDFMARVGLTALPIAGGILGRNAAAQEAAAGHGASSYPGAIVRQTNPENLEFPFSAVDGFITPVERFYVRNHFAAPELEASSWKLKVEGAVDRPFELDYDELRKMPSKTVPALLECAGNSRVLLKPPQGGVRWHQGAVGTAEWTGVPLAAILDKAGLKDKAVAVVLEGTDTGTLGTPVPTPGEISFARSLPVAKAKSPEVILAYKMNGEDLTVEHGRPVRAIVPGWYGMASVKWLKRILVTDRPFQGYFETISYSIWDRHNGLPVMVPLSELAVKSQIARPTWGEIIPAKSEYRVFGAAWSGESPIAKVEVSTDGGKTWSDAKFHDKQAPFAWRLWDYSWSTPAKAGRYTLMARATDKRGRVQPMERDNDRRDIMISHVQPITVEVRSA
jgi:DMSO/TMAO reductase YedYZ molybdopterin-dependent catalytic subunit